MTLAIPQKSGALGRLVALSLLLTLGALALQAQTVPTAQSLIARHDSLIGGRRVLESHSSMKLTGSFTLAAAGIEAPLEILKRKPNQYLFRTSLGQMGELLQGYDGTTAWAVQPGQGAMLLTGDQGKQIAEQADFFADLHDTTRFSAMETVGEADFEGKRAWQVKLTRKDGTVLNEYFDVTTGLSAGGTTTIQSQMGPLETTAVYADYKDFNGLRMATRIVQRNPQFEIVLSIATVEFDVVDAAAVAMPEAVKALIK